MMPPQNVQTIVRIVLSILCLCFSGYCYFKGFEFKAMFFLVAPISLATVL